MPECLCFLISHLINAVHTYLLCDMKSKIKMMKNNMLFDQILYLRVVLMQLDVHYIWQA